MKSSNSKTKLITKGNFKKIYACAKFSIICVLIIFPMSTKK